MVLVLVIVSSSGAEQTPPSVDAKHPAFPNLIFSNLPLYVKTIRAILGPAYGLWPLAVFFSDNN
jgi:hypothetical protein